FNYGNIPYYMVLGVLTGLNARYFLVVGIIVKWFFAKFKKQVVLRAIIGGSMLSMLCVAFPPLFGEGYLNIRILHQGNMEHLIHESLFRYFELDSSQFIIIVFLSLTVLFK